MNKLKIWELEDIKRELVWKETSIDFFSILGKIKHLSLQQDDIHTLVALIVWKVHMIVETGKLTQLKGVNEVFEHLWVIRLDISAEKKEIWLRILEDPRITIDLLTMLVPRTHDDYEHINVHLLMENWFFESEISFDFFMSLMEFRGLIIKILQRKQIQPVVRAYLWVTDEWSKRVYWHV